MWEAVPSTFTTSEEKTGGVMTHAQPQDGDKVNANPEQRRMGNKIRVSAGLSQTKPCGMLKLMSAVICIFITLISELQWLAQVAIAAWMPV